MRMNFSPFAGHHFAGAIPAIHQFAASGALASSSSAAASNGSSDQRYPHPHHHAGASSGQPSSSHGGGGQALVNIPQFNQSQLLGKLRGASEEMNKYGHGSTNGGGNPQGSLHHYGAAQQYSEGPENGSKHLRVGNSSHALGLNAAMANGAAYHQGNADQGQELGHVRRGRLIRPGDN